MKDKVGLRITTGVLHILFTIGTMLISGMLLFVLINLLDNTVLINESFAETTGIEIDIDLSEMMTVLLVVIGVFFFISLMLFIHGILLMTSKPSKFPIAVINTFYWLILIVAFILVNAWALLVLPIVLYVCNICIAVNTKGRSKDKDNVVKEKIPKSNGKWF